MPTGSPARDTTREILDADALARTLARIAHELIERNDDLGRLALVGIHTRGVPLAHAAALARRGAERGRARRSARSTSRSTATTSSSAAGRPRSTRSRSCAARELDFPLEGRTCVLVDDVLYTGRTIRAAIDALFDFGRPDARAARGARRPRAPRAPDPARLRRQEPPDRARRARPGRARRGRRASTGSCSSPRPKEDSAWLSCDRRTATAPPARRSATSTRQDVERILDTARALARSLDREVKKLPTLRGRHRRQPLLRVLDADARRASSSPRSGSRPTPCRSAPSGSSVDKGESLKDTALTLAAYDPDVIVIRHPHDRRPAARRRASRTRTSSTRATASTSTRRRRCSTSTRCARRSAGSRASTSRSSATSSTRASPARSSRRSRWSAREPTLVGAADAAAARDRGARAATSRTDIEAIADADVVYVLRMQRERMRGGASSPRCASTRRSTASRPSASAPGQVVMHPGPMNRGVEIDPRVADSGRVARRRPGARRASSCGWPCSTTCSRAPGLARRREPRHGGRVMLVVRERRAGTRSTLRGARVRRSRRGDRRGLRRRRVEDGVDRRARAVATAPERARRSRRRSSTRTSTCARPGREDEETIASGTRGRGGRRLLRDPRDAEHRAGRRLGLRPRRARRARARGGRRPDRLHGRDHARASAGRS